LFLFLQANTTNDNSNSGGVRSDDFVVARTLSWSIGNAGKQARDSGDKDVFLAGPGKGQTSRDGGTRKLHDDLCAFVHSAPVLTLSCVLLPTTHSIFHATNQKQASRT